MAQGWARLVALIVTTMIACSAPQSSNKAVPPPSKGQDAGIYPQGRLELQGDPRSVIVRINGEPALTVGEFNERLMEFPVGDEGQDVVAARRYVLDQMIDAKVIAREAAKRRSVAAPVSGQSSSYQTERALAQSLIKTSVANPLLVSNGDARKYYVEHRGAFQQLDASNASEEERMLFIKFKLLSERFQEKIRTWRSQESIEISDNLLKD